MTSNSDYREHYRHQHISAQYSGRAHLAFVLIFSIGGIVYCASQLESVGWLEWLTLPLAFLYANLVEYAGHRWVMHRKVPVLGQIYKRHAGQHHHFFTHEYMAMDFWLDCKAVLFPPLLMVFFFGAFAAPSGLVLALVATSNVAWLFVIVALAYYLNYELLHLAYHLPENSRILRLPFLKTLRRQHHLHHRKSLMSHKNFNITYPIFDWVFDTRA
ncbi:MAG: fatty acid hydroxylase family protein [Wenzhouxiangella sp.]|nr:fatty acid hydroxylase family protein [Wenzhouxiangella sp.]